MYLTFPSSVTVTKISCRLGKTLTLQFQSSHPFAVHCFVDDDAILIFHDDVPISSQTLCERIEKFFCCSIGTFGFFRAIGGAQKFVVFAVLQPATLNHQDDVVFHYRPPSM